MAKRYFVILMRHGSLFQGNIRRLLRVSYGGDDGLSWWIYAGGAT